MQARSKLDGLSEPLCTIKVPDPDPEIAERTTDLLEDCRYIGSYDWVPEAEEDDPAIVVPGSPNVWTNPTLPLTVIPDRGKQFRDHNGYILPGRPLLPLVAAVHEQQIFPKHDWKTVDFVTDRNGLRKLFRWVTQASGRNDFRIDTQLVGKKTIVLNRWEPKTTGFMNGSSYGFNFEKATTKPMPPATERSAWHHRIVTYKFGRFRMIVQFEVDGCLSEDQSASSSQEDDVVLIGAMANMGLSNQRASSTAAPASSETKNLQQRSSVFGLKVHHQGNANIPHSSILELTTSAKRVDWKDRYPQLYFSQTGNHIAGRHTNGTFHTINIVPLSSIQCQSAIANLQPSLKKLEEALRQIQSIVVEHGKQEHLSLVYEKPSLTVHRRLESSSCFPPEALALFD